MIKYRRIEQGDIGKRLRYTTNNGFVDDQGGMYLVVANTGIVNIHTGTIEWGRDASVPFADPAPEPLKLEDEDGDYIEVLPVGNYGLITVHDVEMDEVACVNLKTGHLRQLSAYLNKVAYFLEQK